MKKFLNVFANKIAVMLTIVALFCANTHTTQAQVIYNINFDNPISGVNALEKDDVDFILGLYPVISAKDRYNATIDGCHWIGNNVFENDEHIISVKSSWNWVGYSA